MILNTDNIVVQLVVNSNSYDTYSHTSHRNIILLYVYSLATDIHFEP